MRGDSVTEWSRRALNILFVSNPTGTSIGFCVGIFLHGIFGFFTPSLKVIAGVDVAAVKIYHFIVFSVFAINLPSYFRRHKISPEIVSVMNEIERQYKNGVISRAEKVQAYRNLNRRILDSVVVTSKASGVPMKINSIGADGLELDDKAR